MDVDEQAHWKHNGCCTGGFLCAFGKLPWVHFAPNDAAVLQWCYFLNSERFKGEKRHETTVQVLSNLNISIKYPMNFWNTSFLPVDLHNYFLYSWNHQWGLYLDKPQQGKLCKRYNWSCCSELKFSQFKIDLTAAGCKQDEIFKCHKTKEICRRTMSLQENLACV